MNRLPILFACLLVLLYSSVSAQTWGCPERDFKCQLDVVTKALKANPKDPENYYNMGLVFQRSGSHKEAVESFSMYIAIPGLKPEYIADGYNNRGISQRALKKFDLAYADHTKALELNPSKPEFLVNRANASADLQKFSAAMDDYNRAVALDPKYASAYAQRGILHTREARLDDAIADFGKSIAIDPTYPEPYYNRGVIYSGKKEFAKALPDYEKYVTLISDPLYLADGYMNLGIAHYYTGNPQKAMDNFNKVIEIRPNWANGYKARAMLNRELKKTDLADADERKAAELSKTSN